jgi:uncharacterized membrane protein affecting hemolysin expression
MTEIITVIANIALALSFIVALVFGIAQVKISARDRKERFTLETLRNLREILIRQTESRVVKIANPQQAMQSCLKSLEAIVGGGESFDY